LILLFVATGGTTGGFAKTWAQEVGPSVREAYFRVVGEYFEVPLQEVSIIGEWDVPPDEVPVVLFLAQQAGVSPDALIGVRRGTRPWVEVASRFGVDPGAFHMPLPQNADLGLLNRVYEEFRTRPARAWGEIRLEDPEIVALVNLRVLCQTSGASPVEVIRAREEAGSFLAAYPRLFDR
jgi:hypothetical protein